MCAPNQSRAAGFAEIHDSHAGLPKIRLPDGTIGPFDEIAMSRGLGKESRALSNVGVDPYADLQAAVVESPQHSERIGKDERIPLEVYPLKFAHPKAVEVKDVQRQVPSLHPINKAVDGGLIVVCRKRSREPQTERPRRRQPGRPVRAVSLPKNLFRCRPVNQEVFKPFTFERELDPRHLFGRNLKGDWDRFR